MDSCSPMAEVPAAEPRETEHAAVGETVERATAAAAAAMHFRFAPPAASPKKIDETESIRSCCCDMGSGASPEADGAGRTSHMPWHGGETPTGVTVALEPKWLRSPRDLRQTKSKNLET